MIPLMSVVFVRPDAGVVVVGVVGVVVWGVVGVFGAFGVVGVDGVVWGVGVVTWPESFLSSLSSLIEQPATENAANAAIRITRSRLLIGTAFPLSVKCRGGPYERRRIQTTPEFPLLTAGFGCGSRFRAAANLAAAYPWDVGGSRSKYLKAS